MGMLRTVYGWLHPTIEEPKVLTGPTQIQADAAVQEARRALEAAKEQDEFVTRLAERAEVQLKTNHFAEMLEYSMTMRGRS